MTARDRIEVLVGEFLRDREASRMDGTYVELRRIVVDHRSPLEELREALVDLCIRAVGEATLLKVK